MSVVPVRHSSRHPSWIEPDWHLPRIGAVMTTRLGGISAAPFDSLNLRAGIGDAPASVLHNQCLLEAAIGARPVYLEQVHGARVVQLDEADLSSDAAIHRADASVTTRPGIACAVQVADCLPVLFAANNGRAVGAAHAGWRGLAAGVLEATLHSVCDAAGCAPSDVQAWLGACIGPTRFEVGPDVLQAFGVSTDASSSTSTATSTSTSTALRFKPCGHLKWLADLPALASDRLMAAGLAARPGGGSWCTVSDASRFFSFRRDRLTGRMAALVWIEADVDKV